MATEVTFPEMGEEVEDVTISRWLVDEGEHVNAGDPLLEIATDKVDTEVPAPVSGTLLSVNFGEGEIVDLNAVIAVIGEASEVLAKPTTDTAGEDDDAGQPALESAPGALNAPQSAGEQDGLSGGLRATPVARRIAAEAGIALSAVPSRDGSQITKGDVEEFLQGLTRPDRKGQEAGSSEDREIEGASPGPDDSVARLEVRRLAATYDLDLRDVARGRPLQSLTRHDLIAYARSLKGLTHLTEADYPAKPPSRRPQEAGGKDSGARRGQETQARQASSDETLVPHSRMRQIIARNMVRSAFTAPHVTTVHTVDMGTVTAHYQANKAGFAQQGARLTLTAYIVAAVVEGLRAVPAVNAEWTEEGLLLKHSINIGMAVALPADATGVGGLIVPVIHNAGDMNLTGIARHVADLAARARDNQLTAADTQGGTFTLTNYGTSGSLFQTPVILQPQVAILGTGAIEKRPVVVSRAKPYEASVDDYLSFRPMMDLALSYDHRALDGASADAFCAAVKVRLENWSDSGQDGRSGR